MIVGYVVKDNVDFKTTYRLCAIKVPS